MEKTLLISDSQRLAASLGQFPEPEIKPAFIVISGLPGTGKSHFSRKLAERLPFLILESDAFRKVLFPLPTYTAQESSRLFRAIHQLIEELLKKGVPVILDATNLSEPYRERLYNIAEQLNARLILVSVEAPPDVVRKRLKSRIRENSTGNSSDADWSVYQMMKPMAQVIRRKHYTVDTSGDITPVLYKIVREVKK